MSRWSASTKLQQAAGAPVRTVDVHRPLLATFLWVFNFSNQQVKRKIQGPVRRAGGRQPPSRWRNHRCKGGEAGGRWGGCRGLEGRRGREEAKVGR